MLVPNGLKKRGNYLQYNPIMALPLCQPLWLTQIAVTPGHTKKLPRLVGLWTTGYILRLVAASIRPFSGPGFICCGGYDVT